MKRKCKNCPEPTKNVCRYVFGVFWCIKSQDGKGCSHSLDAVSAAWRRSGWEMGRSAPVPISVNESKTVSLVQDNLFPATAPLSDADY